MTEGTFVEESPKCIKRSVKFGGGVMVGGISDENILGHWCAYMGVNAAVNKELMKQHFLPVPRNPASQPALFMQDNASCNKAKTVMRFFTEENAIGLLRAQT